MPRSGVPARARNRYFEHDRRMRRHRAATQIIAVGKAAGNNDQIEVRQFGVAVPDFERRFAGQALKCVEYVLFAVGAGKNDDGGEHRKAGFVGF